MRKIRCYGAVLGVLAAAAVSVTACKGTAAVGVSSGAETMENSASESVKLQEEGAGDGTADETSDVGGKADAADANRSSENGAVSGFHTLEPLATGENDGSIMPAAQPITGAEPAEGEALDGIPIDAEKSEAVSIYYGAVCYSYFSEEKEKIKEVAELFRGFSLEEAGDAQLDEAAAYQVYFSTDTEQVAAVNVDKNGVFYIPEEKKFYRIKAGTFHFEELDRIYKDSMYQDGFDENQCLIQ